MRIHLSFLLLFVLTSSFAQKTNQENFYGTWKLQGVMLRQEIVSFYSADTLIHRLKSKWIAENPGMELPKGDSVAITLGATFLSELLYNLEMVVNSKNELVFYFKIRKGARVDMQMQALKFKFKDNTTLTAVDEKGYSTELKIVKLTPDFLIMSGISSARNMELCFRKL